MTATREEIERLLRENDFRYHRVPLPHGLATPGRDRSPTAAIVLPQRLDGKSVLDVGCALGYFCFEAEKRGAARVVGVEMKRKRYRQALMLRDVLASKVEFERRDVLSGSIGETFDLVLALNLIHHLSDPFAGIRRLAELTRDRLVLEFPTFADRRFRRYAGVRLWRLYERRPLIGVSSARKANSTFVFSRPALRRLVTGPEQGGSFARVEFLRSPMEERTIAICEKGAAAPDSQSGTS